MPTLNDVVGVSTSSSTTSFADNWVIVEPLGGPTTVEDVMDRFPPDVYQQSRDTHLYALLNALCGDSGAGLAKKQAYIARLAYEASFLNFKVLDQIYEAQFQMHRLYSETYEGIESTDANTDDLWERAQLADNAYFTRVKEFWTGTRSGNSPTGIETVAQAGSGLECEIVEHYKYIYDQFSDDPLGLSPDGISIAAEEFVVIPRYDPDASYHYVPDVLPDWTFDPPALADDPTVRRKITDLGVSDTGVVPSPVYVYGLPQLNPDIERNTLDLLDRIKPVDTFATVRLEEVDFLDVTLPNPTASSIFLSLIRYVSGNPQVAWPTPNPAANMFIEPNVEKPTGNYADSAIHTPPVFYTILSSGIRSYSDGALRDPTYGTPAFYAPADDGIAPVDAFPSQHYGPFFDPIPQVYPHLASQSEQAVFPVSSAVAVNSTPLVLRGPS